MTDMMQGQMAQILANAGFDVNDGGEDGSTVETPPAIETPTIEEEPTSLTLEDGSVVSIDDIERWRSFEATLRDPRFIQAYTDAYGEPETPSTPTTPVAPTTPQLSQEIQDELSINPVARYLYDQLQASNARYDELSSNLGNIQEAQSLTEQRNAFSLINQARSNFSKEHNLSTEDMDRIYNTTLNMFNLNNLVSLPVNPLSGKAEVPDPVRRIEEAFSAAYYAIPEFREADYTARQEAARSEAERKSKLTSLSTSGSSAPPATPAAPTDPSSRRAALRDEIAAIQAGTYIQPE